MDSYTKIAEKMLARSDLMAVARETLEDQISFLEGELAETGEMSGGRRAKLQLKIEDTRHRLRALYEEMERMDRGYAVLTEYQRDLLEKFIVHRTKDCVEELSEIHCKERSALYRDRKKALETFTMAVYGTL